LFSQQTSYNCDEGKRFLDKINNALFGTHEIGKKWQRGKRTRGEAVKFAHLVSEKYRGEITKKTVGPT